MKRYALAAVVAAALAVGALARGGDGASPNPAGCREWLAAQGYAREIAAVKPLVPRMKRAFAAPGLSVAIAADGKLVWSESCGLADVARRRPVRRETMFRIGSVAKTLTAAAAARLAQRGRLKLDVDVRRYVPSFPPKRAPLTARQLGGHLAGVRHYRGAEALSTTHYRSLAQSLRIFKDDPLVAPPGTEFSYSSYGFNLLGAAIEGANGDDFRSALTSLVLAPLGLANTRLDDGRREPQRASFYEVTSARTARPAPRVDLSNRYPSGGMLSTADDLARFGVGVSNGRFLNDSMQALLFTSQRTRSGEPTRYGFGFEVQDAPFGRVAGHTGNVVGGTAFLLVHPRTRTAVALVTNVGFVTARTPPELGRDVPTPPQLLLPFVRAAAG